MCDVKFDKAKLILSVFQGQAQQFWICMLCIRKQTTATRVSIIPNFLKKNLNLSSIILDHTLQLPKPKKCIWPLNWSQTNGVGQAKRRLPKQHLTVTERSQFKKRKSQNNERTGEIWVDSSEQLTFLNKGSWSQAQSHYKSRHNCDFLFENIQTGKRFDRLDRLSSHSKTQTNRGWHFFFERLAWN